MEITAIDRAACKQIRDAVKPAVVAAAAELGLEVVFGNGSYDPAAGTFSTKIEFVVPGREEREFARNCGLFGLTADQFGAYFQSGGKRFRLTGFNPSAPKYPIKAEEVSTGKTYKLTEQAIAGLKTASVS